MAERGLAVVTGGSRGIGRAVALRLGLEGYEVVATGRDPDALTELENEARGEGIRSLRGAVCDAADEDAVAGLFEGLGDVEVLVANAGMGRSAPLGRITLQDWHDHLAVNATGVFLALRAVVPAMRRRGRGRVVVVASVAGLVGAPYIAAYTAAKHAAVGLMRAAAAEVAGSGATVNAVCPGYVRTPMTDTTIANIGATTGRSEDEARHYLESSQKLGRLVEPEEVADAVAYLCGELAAAVNGQALVLDGGGVQW